VDTYSWYLAAVIPKSEASLLEEGSSVTISIDETTPVTATIAAINTDDADRSAVIVKCTHNASNIFEKRTVEFEICYEEYSGLYVPSAAIRIRDDITGVYVINRNESVSFRCVDILLQEEDYYIVRSSYTPPEEVKYAPLKIYDDILVNPEAMRFNELDK
jgi:putative membrane fusion protein